MKRALIALVVLVAGIQFIPVEQINPPVVSDFSGPSDVGAILKRSCYDCHSNETQWPWYSHVAPVSWLVAHDVAEGREHLDFSNWEPLKDVVYIRAAIHGMVAKGEMPPKIYLLGHPGAAISDADLAILKNWGE